MVIGINGYANDIGRLNYAVNDADAFARLIIEELGFPREQVFVILDPPPKPSDAPYHLTADKATYDTIRRLLVDESPEKSRRMIGC